MRRSRIWRRSKANPKKSEYDDYVISEFSFTAYAGQKNYEAAEAPLEADDGLQVHATG